MIQRVQVGAGSTWQPNRCYIASESAVGGTRNESLTPTNLVKVLAAIVLTLAFAGLCRAGTISPRQLLEVADFSAPVVSPDGRQVAYRIERASVERDVHETVWYVQATEGASQARRVGEGGVALRDAAGVVSPAPALWSSDGRRLYYRAMIDGRIDVWRAAADGSGAVPITNDAADVRDFVLEAGGGIIRYSIGATREEVIAAEQSEYDRGVRIDANVPLGQGLFRSGNVGGRFATQRFAELWFDRIALLDDVPDRWISLDLRTGTKRAADAPISSARFPAKRDTPGIRGDDWKSIMEPDGSRIATLTRIGDGSGQFQRPDVLLSVKGREIVECGAEQCVDKSITGIQWRPGHDELLFTVSDPDQGIAQSIYRWNIGTGEVSLVVQSTGLVAGGRTTATDCGITATILICVAAEASRPPRLERIELDSGERTVIFDPNERLASDMAKGPPVRLLQWEDAHGQRFSGQFYPVPDRGSAPTPLFVTYYSCPGFVRGGVGDEWPLISLAQAGIAALCINQLPGYTMDAVERHGQGLSAVRSVIDLLSASGEIDRSRVGMGGLSFGGAVTLWTATESDLLAAASVANPVVSPLYYLTASIKGDGFRTNLHRMWGLGSLEETPERWRAMSPVFKLDRFRAPVLFQHSEQEYMYALDYVVPLLLEKRADLYVFSNEPHQKFQPRHKLAAYERNFDWFRFWLQGYEDPEPQKQDQYSHWRAMKQAADTRQPD